MERWKRIREKERYVQMNERREREKKRQRKRERGSERHIIQMGEIEREINRKQEILRDTEKERAKEIKD